MATAENGTYAVAQIRDVTIGDAQQLVAIYNHYILNSIATFEEEPISSSEMQTRIRKVLDANFPWIVVTDASSRILGYAYACEFKTRRAYRFTLESSVYLDNNIVGQFKGVGSLLY